MKLVDKYIYAVGQKLPLKGREDTKKELKSLLLDEIEEKYGKDPAEEDIKEAISSFGSPGKVARKYSGEKMVISPGYTDIYFLVCGIMIFAMFIAYTTVFLVGLFTEGYTDILNAVLKIPLNVITTSLSGIGAGTIVFIIMTRIFGKNQIDFEKDWTPEELNGVVLEDQRVSKTETIISVSLLAVLILLTNIFPEVITLAEDVFVNSNIPLGHRIDLENFRFYLIFLSIIWSGEIVYNLTLFKAGSRKKYLVIMENILSGCEIIIFAKIIIDSSLYTYDTGLIGFKIIFGIVLVVNLVELIARNVKLLIKKLSG
jgi:hypothetical protein